jgi:DNA-binding Lrp family transcriptional regulator
MTEVLVLLCCESGCQDGVVDSLRAVPGVVEASAITGGAYDIVVRISAGSMAEAKSSIASGIRRIQGIKTSTVLIRKAERQAPAQGRESRYHHAAA